MGERRTIDVGGESRIDVNKPPVGIQYFVGQGAKLPSE